MGKWQSFKQYMTNLKRGLLWVTHSIHINCKDPAYGMILRLARTMRSELSVDIVTLETDSFSAAAWTTLLRVFDHFRRCDKEPDTDLDPNSRCRKEQSSLGATTGYQSIKSCPIQGSCRRAVSVVLK